MGRMPQAGLGRCSRVLIRFLVAEHDHLAAQWNGHQLLLPQHNAPTCSLLKTAPKYVSWAQQTKCVIECICWGMQWRQMGGREPFLRARGVAAGKGENGKHCWNLLSHLNVTSLCLLKLFMSGFVQGSHLKGAQALCVYASLWLLPATQCFPNTGLKPTGS